MTGYLLDTNVISELIKPAPNAQVTAWIRSVNETDLHLSVLSFAELRHGIEQLPRGARRNRLQRWMEFDLTDRFEGRILAIDKNIAETWGIIMARVRAAGVRPPSMDTLFAATAEALGLTMVTRNTRDFALIGVAVVNPWGATSET